MQKTCTQKTIKTLMKEIKDDTNRDICMQVRKQQVELDMEEQTGSK